MVNRVGGFVMRLVSALAAAALSVVVAGQAHAVIIDGTLDVDYGAAKSTVFYDPGAPTSNFDTPGTTNHLNGYSIYLLSQPGSVYGFIQVNGPNNSLVGSNLYWDLNPPALAANGSSDLGFDSRSRTSARSLRASISELTERPRTSSLRLPRRGSNS